MYCSRCGLRTKPRDRFCPRCGTRLAFPKPNPETPSAAEKQNPPRNPSKAGETQKTETPAPPQRHRSKPEQLARRAYTLKRTPSDEREYPHRASAPQVTPSDEREYTHRASAPQVTPSDERGFTHRANAPQVTPSDEHGFTHRASAPQVTLSDECGFTNRANAPKDEPPKAVCFSPSEKQNRNPDQTENTSKSEQLETNDNARHMTGVASKSERLKTHENERRAAGSASKWECLESRDNGQRATGGASKWECQETLDNERRVVGGASKLERPETAKAKYLKSASLYAPTNRAHGKGRPSKPMFQAESLDEWVKRYMGDASGTRGSGRGRFLGSKAPRDADSPEVAYEDNAELPSDWERMSEAPRDADSTDFPEATYEDDARLSSDWERGSEVPRDIDFSNIPEAAYEDDARLSSDWRRKSKKRVRRRMRRKRRRWRRSVIKARKCAEVKWAIFRGRTRVGLAQTWFAVQNWFGRIHDDSILACKRLRRAVNEAVSRARAAARRQTAYESRDAEKNVPPFSTERVETLPYESRDAEKNVPPFSTESVETLPYESRDAKKNVPPFSNESVETPLSARPSAVPNREIPPYDRRDAKKNAPPISPENAETPPFERPSATPNGEAPSDALYAKSSGSPLRSSQANGRLDPDSGKRASASRPGMPKKPSAAKEANAQGFHRNHAAGGKTAVKAFLVRHIRTVIATGLLAITLLFVGIWCRVSVPGQRLFAQLGLGGAQGYIIMGDECMETAKYTRAVEYYYRALTKRADYETAIRLAEAYRKTGQTDRETSALLLCADQFGEHIEPYQRLKELYPNAATRPEAVKEALLKGVSIFSDITLAY